MSKATVSAWPNRSCTLGVEAIDDTYEHLDHGAEKSCVGSQQATHGKGHAEP
jgi:hypothetical protein